LYSSVDTYIEDARKDNREALEREANEKKLRQ
jgi:hypothetical protein